MESEMSLDHLPFFEALAKMDESDPAWRSVSAGLVVMRLVDEWIRSGGDVGRSGAWGVSAVRDAISEVPDAAPLRRILSGIVDTICSSDSLDIHALSPRLMAYGQALEYDAKWSLAADVYVTLVRHTDPAEDADLVVPAFLQLAFALRTLGQLDDAAAAYEQASRVAYAAGDLMGVLGARLGDARIAVTRGNMPQAETILEETICRAQAEGFHEIRSRALHERAYIAGLAGHHDRAVRLAYAAMEATQTPPYRDRVLTNIATGLRHLGLVDAARDAYLVLAQTAQEPYVRWMAELNLMEMAADQGLELQFDRYRRDLEEEDFTPLIRVTYLIHVGRGYHSLGDSEQGIPYLERAIELAAEFKFNRLLFEAEGVLNDAKRRKTPERRASSYAGDSEIQDVVEAVHRMRQTAGIA
jgi:tetratricopeptide (TPR) repeat protein